MKKTLVTWGRWILTVVIVVGLVLFARTVNWHDTWAEIK